ncbi:hypothetical protein Hanom_Chr17g01552581 [Helianthus anomalus]
MLPHMHHRQDSHHHPLLCSTPSSLPSLQTVAPTNHSPAISSNIWHVLQHMI